MKPLLMCLLLSPILFCCRDNTDPANVLNNAHAHNDYYNQRPLLDALELGFISIEADIHLLNDQLYVAHDSVEIRSGRTLQNLYLDPLKRRIKRNGGSVYQDTSRLILLVDIKTDSDDTYRQLHDLLSEYREILTVYRNGIVEPGAVLVIISGNRPIGYMREQPVRYAAIDGRFENLNAETGPQLFPLVSEKWTDHFSWNGRDAMPEEEKSKLDSIVRRLHAGGHLLRFWATQDSASAERDSVWTRLLHSGVDLIGTDDLKGLSAFLNGEQIQ